MHDSADFNYVWLDHFMLLTTFSFISGADALHTSAILNWVQGLNNNGSVTQPVPGIFGGNFQVKNCAAYYHFDSHLVHQNGILVDHTRCIASYCCND